MASILMNQVFWHEFCTDIHRMHDRACMKRIPMIKCFSLYINFFVFGLDNENYKTKFGVIKNLVKIFKSKGKS
jgi:hypothetical protein